MLDPTLNYPQGAVPLDAAVLYKDAPVPSDQLFIYMQGGGSCDSVSTCNPGPSQPKNPYGYSSSDFRNDTKLATYLYLRDAPYVGSSPRVSPFSQMNMAMVPYCTGDAHSGNQTRNDGNANGQKFYFWGNKNFQVALQALLARYDKPNHPIHTIWLMGTSAGGGGAAVQYSYVRDTFITVGSTGKQVHLIEDSSPVVAPLQNPTYVLRPM